MKNMTGVQITSEQVSTRVAEDLLTEFVDNSILLHVPEVNFCWAAFVARANNLLKAWKLEEKRIPNIIFKWHVHTLNNVELYHITLPYTILHQKTANEVRYY